MNNLQKRILTSIVIFPLSIFFIVKGGNYIVSFLYAVLILGNFEVFSVYFAFFSLFLGFFHQNEPKIRENFKYYIFAKFYGFL